MRKKAISLLMTLILLTVSGVPVCAMETGGKAGPNSQFQIMLVNVDDAEAYLNFSGDRAECSSVIDGKSGTSKITANAYLKRVKGNTKTVVKSWTGLSASGESFYFNKSYYVSSGYTYEFEINAHVYRNGQVENISVTDSDYCG